MYVLLCSKDECLFPGKLHAVPASLKGQYVIRFTVTSPRTTSKDLERDWQIIRAFAYDIVGGPMVAVPEEAATAPARPKMKLKGMYNP